MDKNRVQGASGVSSTSRTAVYGPVRTVVWEGRSREAPPFPDLWHQAAVWGCPHSRRVLEGYRTLTTSAPRSVKVVTDRAIKAWYRPIVASG
jgi:hypothetical protein